MSVPRRCRRQCRSCGKDIGSRAAGEIDNFGPCSSILNGGPVTAVVAARPSLAEGGEYQIRPPFVSIAGEMTLTCRDGKTARFGV